MLRNARMVVRPFLDPPSPESLDLDTSAGIPFCYEVPVPSCQTSMQPIGRHGSLGPLNGAWRWTREEWVMIEFNPRFYGGTVGRALLGTDEISMATSSTPSRLSSLVSSTPAAIDYDTVRVERRSRSTATTARTMT